MRLNQLEIIVLRYLLCCSGVTKERLAADLNSEPVAHLVLLQLRQYGLVQTKGDKYYLTERGRNANKKIPNEVDGVFELDI